MILTRDDTARAVEDLILLIDEKLQSDLYEKSGLIPQGAFLELMDKFRRWQQLTREIINAAN